MELLRGKYTLRLAEGAFPLSTDSMVLSDFVRLGRNASVLDLGAGCGTLGLLLCAKDPTCHITGVELDEAAHLGALENIRMNQLTDRMDSICADIKAVPQLLRPGSFSVCVSNPPYFTGGFASQALPIARQEVSCTLEDLLRGAAWALKYGGDFFLVHKPERLSEICAIASRYQMEAKRLCLVRHKAADPVNLILLQLRKGAKPGLVWEELVLYQPDGSPTERCREIYHL